MEFNAMTEPCEFLDMLDEFSKLSVQLKRQPFTSTRMLAGILSGNARKAKALQAQMG